MCGIVGYVGSKEAATLLVEGLRKLEYRGYDSAGVAVLSSNGLEIARAKGKLANLDALLARSPISGTTGIGHTRWATHGKPSDENAHPHRFEKVAVVHNGIIENHIALRDELRAAGHEFASETDTEIFAHLIARELAAGAASLGDAVRSSLESVRGAYALVVTSEDHPSEIVAAKNASPMVLGLGEGENFVASDVPALLSHTRQVIFLEEGEVAEISADRIRLTDLAGKEKTRAAQRIDWSPVMAEKGGHKHFMHKEIHEQPRALADTLRGRFSEDEGDTLVGEVDLDRRTLETVRRITILACGTSWHAGLVGKQLIERLARIPVEVDLASEFRYREPVVDGSVLALAISQSGETIDTLAALREAKRLGARTMAVCNVLGSAIAREADDVLYTHAGPEIGVASTKAFTTQLTALALLAIRLGRLTGHLDAEAGRRWLAALRELPTKVEKALEGEAKVVEVAHAILQARDVLFLGRGPQAPVALEGALKLKEISYIHAEGYAAGEMKHGPIALIETDLPVVVIATKDATYEKTIGNIEEVRARGGKVVAIVTEGDTHVRSIADHVIEVPDCVPLLMPVVTSIPLQLLAYHVADLRGTDVDQPRNLAKSVTVE
ncbi:glutamine--fructose-6-phosphate transaminase (isomerizing) [Vulgatibacter incomptus]|uniref:Glutamine--fructose-6-phosphate aminotransferase [isomerizing] n=1 Tax=Vulgatibacter incomptus TaxID=1391653 RepID=A0A0K1PFC8_9BACT|nr:glutamine--fructose-6-phosphate transaminase (isomerizing) [Vulgatibacter incomptus]AKU92141.1 Glucosamine-fructose-6-phosphate aminotransferase, isomerising [Vulgatibacter incomptus]